MQDKEPIISSDSSTHDPAQKHFTIEEAANFLKEKKETFKEDIKKEAQKQQATIAPEGDKKRYLKYCISLLEMVDNDLMLKLPDNIRVSYSRKDMANFFKAFLSYKIDGYSDRVIAKTFGVPLNAVKNIDILAQEAVWRRIKELKESGIPLVGGA
jgi:hypothetical protein